MSYMKEKGGIVMDAFVDALIRKHVQLLPPLSAYPVNAQRFAAGECLARAGEPLTRLCFVVEGRATVTSTMENGRAVLLTEYRGVSTIGELELLMEYPTLTSDIRAITAGVMLCIPLTEARERLVSDPAMLRYLGREVARKLERTSRLAAQDRLYPLAARVAAYLLYAQRDALVCAHLTRLSELMGASYRHLLRTLREFCDAGWIARESGGYRVLNRDALLELAGEIRYD
jgi:CRP/FNR family transcriptional regulator, putaive post-exponential-phase nitrogen-starvation regulator